MKVAPTIRSAIDVLPDLAPMPDRYGDRATIAGVILLVCALAALAWRGWPAVTGRAWRQRGDDPAHLPRAAQRVEDIVLPVSFVVMAIGLLERDWGWQLAGFGLAVGWILAVVAFGLKLEAEDPSLAHTTATLFSEPVDPVAPTDDESRA